VQLGIPGKEDLVTNEEVLSMETLPRLIAFVGGGYIAPSLSTSRPSPAPSGVEGEDAEGSSTQSG
jgi:hypothetical protein